MKKIFTVLIVTSASLTFAQNLSFTDPKLKKLLLSSSTTSNIAVDFSGNKIAIDANNDGEIQLSEANNIKVLTIKQDPSLKYTIIDTNGNKTINQTYYQAYLPENITDVLLFKNLEEIYVHDTKTLNIHIKDNDKLRVFKVYVPEIKKTITLENCTGFNSFNDIQVHKNLDNYNFEGQKLTIINSPNLGGDVVYNDDVNDLTILNSPLKSFTFDTNNKTKDRKLTITNAPNLKSIIVNEKNKGNSYLNFNKIEIDASNNPNLEEIIINGDSYNNKPLTISKLTVNGSLNLKKLKGLNIENADFSKLGLTKLEDLDISFYNKYEYSTTNSSVVKPERIFGETTSINLNDLPNLKNFRGFNQKFSSIDFSNNSLLEDIDLVSTIDNIETLDISNKINLKRVNLSNYDVAKAVNKNLIIQNNPNLTDLTIYLPPLENFVFKNNTSFKDFVYGDYYYSSMSALELENYNLKNLTLEGNSTINSIDIKGSQLTNLDISKNLDIKKIELVRNDKLTTLKLNDNIEEIRIHEQASFPEIDLKNKSKLNIVYLFDLPQFNNIYFLNNNSLRELHLEKFNNYKTINLGLIPSIQHVLISEGNLETVKLENNKNLTFLSLTAVELKDIDITNAPNLNTFRVFSQLLEKITFDKNKEITEFFFLSDKIKTLNLNTLSKLKYIDTNAENINIRNNSMESEVNLRASALSLCVDDAQVNSIKSQYPDAIISTDCNNQAEKPTVKTFAIYPNPVVDYVEIKSPSIIKEIEINSFFGKSVLKNKPNSYNFKTNLSHLKPGIYWVIVKTEKLFYIKSIIKK